MAFDHDHRPKLSHAGAHDGDGHRPLERYRLMLCMLLTGGMMIAEGIGGWWVNSLALLSDAGHMLTHFSALAVSYLAICFAGRAPTSRVSYGFYRLEILAALLNAATLFLITVGIGIAAYHRLAHPQPVASLQMLGVAIAGLLVNLATAFLLHPVSREDLNVKGAYLHMLSDTFSSVAVIGGALLMWWKRWYIADPILSVIICLVILVWAWRLLRDAVVVLMEATPAHIDVEAVRQSLLQQVNGVRDVHDVHIWAITSGLYAMTAHVRIDDCSISASMRIRAHAATVLDREYDISHAILQFEC
ncbi:MAG: cation transporter [Deltaproteobacteria bacterium]|nr:cation transporter [Deltaproteobacteria bacterium]